MDLNFEHMPAGELGELKCHSNLIGCLFSFIVDHDFEPVDFNFEHMPAGELGELKCHSNLIGY